MKFSLACYGTRGDIEPSAAVGRELMRRGHEVHMAVSPELVSFVEAAGLATIPYGPELQDFLDEEFLRNMWTEFFRNVWKVRDPIRLVLKGWEPIIRHWSEVGATLVTLANGADLLSTGLNFEQAASNVAEYYDIPLATIHHFPMRVNGRLVSSVPAPMMRSAMTAVEWLFWRSTKDAENAQRRDLGLPKATRRSQQRIAQRGSSLEIQGYDAVCFPGLAAEWAKWGERRPFVGALTMELLTDADDQVASWIDAGKPPICFCFGSIASILHTGRPGCGLAADWLVHSVFSGFDMFTRPVSRGVRGFQGLGPFVVVGTGWLGGSGEGCADAVPGVGDRCGPAPGGVDAEPQLSGAAGDAGGNV